MLDRWGAIDLRKELEARLLGGDCRGVLERAAELLPVGAQPQPGPEAAWAAVMACRAAGALRQWGKAIAWAERGLAFGPDPEATGWLNLLLGTALMYTGDAFRAERCLRTFNTMAGAQPALSRLLADGLFNLGHLLRFLRRDPAAEAETFRHAARAFAAQGRAGQVLLCHAEAAWSYLMAGQPAAALTDLQTADAGLEQHGDPELQTYVQICWALQYRLQGEYARSEAVCRELEARHDLTPGQRADVAWLLAGLAQNQGDWTSAANHAERAYEQALEDLWPLQIARIEALRSSVPVRQAGR